MVILKCFLYHHDKLSWYTFNLRQTYAKVHAKDKYGETKGLRGLDVIWQESILILNKKYTSNPEQTRLSMTAVRVSRTSHHLFLIIPGNQSNPCPACAHCPQSCFKFREPIGTLSRFVCHALLQTDKSNPSMSLQYTALLVSLPLIHDLWLNYLAFGWNEDIQ